MAINRAEQNWPDSEVTVVMDSVLNPYWHELDSRGMNCAHDCPACMFMEVTFLTQDEQARYGEPLNEMERRTR